MPRKVLMSDHVALGLAHLAVKSNDVQHEDVERAVCLQNRHTARGASRLG